MFFFLGFRLKNNGNGYIKLLKTVSDADQLPCQSEIYYAGKG